jgi:integrase
MITERIKDKKKGELDRLMRTKGKHSDGGGLYLQVASPGAASWVWRHKEQWKSVGPANVYTIVEAREIAQKLRKEVHEERDPFQLLKRAAKPKGKTFAKAMGEYLAAKSPYWSPSNRARELRRYEYLFGMVPDFTALHLSEINQDVKNTALATWNGQAKKRRDVGFYIEAIIKYAETGKLRIPGGGLPEAEHHEAMPYADVPAFYARIAKLNSDDAHALRFLILTGARTDEVIGRKERSVWAKARPTWREITEVDGQPMWIIPGRLEDDDDEENFRGMKGKKDHAVPLSAFAMALLGPRRAGDVPLFKVPTNGMLNTLRKFDSKSTVHGFRSSFSDWATECAGYHADIVDACIAHPDDDLTPAKRKVRKSYQRSDLPAKRREIMTAWSDYVAG